MIALDTNILARFVMGDDPAQMKAAQQLIDQLSEDAPGFLGREVLIELVWLLGSVYRLPRKVIGDVIEGFLHASTLVVEADEDVVMALDLYRTSQADFADLMIRAAAARAGCRALYSFDRKLARLDGVTLLEAT